MIYPTDNPFSGSPPGHSEITEAARSMILSASGWRKVFAADGDEESFTPSISMADLYLAAMTALVLTSFLQEETSGRNPLVFIGSDTRPTGPALMNGMMRIFLALGVELRYVSVAAAPELMAAVKLDDRGTGFIYVSASHNPIGHNGFKFGGSDGAVYGGQKSARLILEFQEAVAEAGTIHRINELAKQTDQQVLATLFDSLDSTKRMVLDRYRRFSREVISGSASAEEQDTFFSVFSGLLERHPAGIVGELNGSARGVSIDGQFLAECGIPVEMHNTEPGRVVHRIVPEGRSMDPCRELLAEAHRRNPAFVLGYVPDNDGDRGNLVYHDPSTDAVRAIAAQEVFALTVLSELAFEQYRSTKLRDSRPLAVAVNGPTSMRIEKIARVFNAEVFRGEVGEANVINLAAKLRNRGYRVRILGEGSNGGNITHPATVRDPLNTIFSILRLLAYRGKEAPFTPFRTWCRLSGREELYRHDFYLRTVIDALPPFTTTSAYEAEAIMRIRCEDHGKLKENYEKLFLQEWELRADSLKSQFGIVKWREINYEGTCARTGMGSDFRSEKARGGLKIIFSNERGEDTDFIWMRGSGTEPVFRIMADTTGLDRRRHDGLLELHRKLIEKADRMSVGGSRGAT